MPRPAKRTPMALRPQGGRWWLVALVAMGLLVGGTPVAAAGADAHAARTCSPPRYPGSGYFTSLTVRHVGCATGRRLALAYYRCRTSSGRAGRCHKRVLGYRCSERRNAIATELDG